MSFKSIDMQIAVHKHPDAGLVQRQLAEKPTWDQSASAAVQLKNDAIERRRSPQTTKAEGGTIRHSEERKKGKSDKHAKSRGSAPSEQQADHGETPHPYKGHRLDITL